MKPSTEQQPILDSIAQVGSVKVQAGAGTGKTAVIRMTALSQPGWPILYVCFAKPIQVQAERTMPGNVTSLTQHALAYRVLNIRQEYGARVHQPLLPSLLMKRLRLKEFREALVVRQTLENYCASSDRWIEAHHVPSEAVLALPVPERANGIDRLLDATRRLWTLVVNPKEAELGFPHGVYLKLWQAWEGAPLPTAYHLIAADEFQDFAPVQLDAFSRHPGKKLIIGDKDQSLYGFRWRGQRHQAMNIKTDRIHHLRESYRFGPATATLANQLLSLTANPPPPMVGIGPPTTFTYTDLEPPFTWLFRTNQNLLMTAVRLVREGLRIHVIKGLSEAINLLEGCYHLWRGEPRKVVHPTLRLLGTWRALEEASQYQPDYKLAVQNIKKQGSAIPDLIADVRNAGEAPEGDADVVLSTIHQFKGREADRVQIYPDIEDLITYQAKKGEYRVNEEAVRLAYVAVTRGRQEVSISAPFTHVPDLLLLMGKHHELSTISRRTPESGPHPATRHSPDAECVGGGSDQSDRDV